MIFPDVSVEEWTRRYPGLSPRVASCKHCQSDIQVNKPYISKDYAGFIAFHCDKCGGEHRAHIGRPISKKEINLWNNSFDSHNYNDILSPAGKKARKVISPEYLDSKDNTDWH